MDTIKIIYEDGDILVLDKPSGMVVNRSDTTKGEKTVQDFVEPIVIPNLFRNPESNEMLNQVQHDIRESDFYKRGGIVHRLDKETSGILLVAKNLEAFVNLQAQFKERKVQKTYLALSHGKIEPKEGEINVAVGRLPWNRKRFGVLSGGRESVTQYKTINNLQLTINPTSPRLRGASNEPLTLLELYPKSGRTHQIRVHLQYIHHPIFADPLYAGRKTSRNDRKLLPRVFLHASKISFFHPKTNELISFESPLPEDLNSFLSRLKS
jgi:23S rRNA pseudouridine1911/1915/1917 synthase